MQNHEDYRPGAPEAGSKPTRATGLELEYRPEEQSAEPFSSAGLPTVRLPEQAAREQPETVRMQGQAAPEQPMPSGWTRTRRSDVIALVLVVIGVLGLFGSFVPGQGELTAGLILLTIASCFLFFAFWKRIYGLLIPGCILSGLSVGVTFAAVSGGISVLWGLALGFLAILLLGRALFDQHSPWPTYPAVALFGVGIVRAVTSLSNVFGIGLIWLPLLLIGAGLYLGWRRDGRPNAG